MSMCGYNGSIISPTFIVCWNMGEKVKVHKSKSRVRWTLAILRTHLQANNFSKVLLQIRLSFYKLFGQICTTVRYTNMYELELDSLNVKQKNELSKHNISFEDDNKTYDDY